MNLPKDVYLYLADFADDKTVLNMLSTNKEYNDPEFFKRVLRRRYPASLNFKPENQSWKQYYIDTVYYISKIKDLIGYNYSPSAKKSAKYYYDFIKENIDGPSVFAIGAAGGRRS